MGMPDIYTKAKISPKGKVNKIDLKKMGMNILIFTAPVLAVFFAQLQMGVELKPALLVASVALYGLLADFFKKLNNPKE